MTDPTSAGMDETKMLVWHDPDKALTANLSMAPDLQLPMGGLVGLAASGQGEAYAGIVVSNRVSEDPRYDKEIDNRSHWAQPTTMMCIPILSANADPNSTDNACGCFGVLQIVNKIDPAGFNDYDAQIAAQVPGPFKHLMHRSSATIQKHFSVLLRMGCTLNDLTHISGQHLYWHLSGIQSSPRQAGRTVTFNCSLCGSPNSGCCCTRYDFGKL